MLLEMLEQRLLLSADVAPQDVVVQAEAQFGQPVEVSWVIHNAGADAVTTAWSDKLLLSSDATASADDRLLAIRTSAVSTLGPGEDYAATETVIVPLTSTSADGTYFILVESDGTNVVPESDELNNVAASGPIALSLPDNLIRWDGGAGNTSWHNALNWEGNVLPTATSNVLIDVSGDVQITYSSGSATVNSLVSAERLTVSGGILTVSHALTAYGSVSLNGGSLSVGDRIDAGGDITLAGGTFSVPEVRDLGTGGRIVVAATATINGLASEIPVIVNAGRTLTVQGSNSAAALTLSDTATLNLLEGGSLTVTGAAAIGGIVNATGGNLLATGAGTAFTGSAARVLASGGSQVAIDAPTYSSTGFASATLFSATGAGTVLDLSALTEIDATFNVSNSSTQFQDITATAGGRIDLSGLTKITGPVQNEDYVHIVMSGSTSSMDLSSLQSLLGGPTAFALSDSASLDLPSLQIAQNTYFNLTGGAHLTAAGANPLLYSSTIFDFNPTLFSATGAGTVLDLSALAEIDATFNVSNSSTQFQDITATAGGRIDLSGLTKITGPVQNEDYVHIVMSGSTSSMDLSSLQSLLGVLMSIQN